MRRALPVLCALLALVVLSASTLEEFRYSVFDLRHYLSAQQIAFVRPGLQLEVEEVLVETDRTVRVSFTVSDDRGLPLDLDGVFTPGPVRVRFVLAHIPRGGEQYRAYTTQGVTSPITQVTTEQAANDTRGSFEKQGEGRYRYTFGTRLPSDYNPAATHTVGIYADRNLEEFELGVDVVNRVFHFVPAGGEVGDVRDVVVTQACNQCHDPLQAHGGFRTEMELCVLCHTAQTVDPDTGVSQDMAVLTHKIHRGEDLPSVQAGEPFQVIGFGQQVVDYSTVVYPQDIRNCGSCHTPEASQSAAYLLRPTRASCGSCHDDVDFTSGENHVDLPQLDDDSCSSCHLPEGELEFDASVRGAHTIPARSTQLEGIHFELLDLVNTGPGENPSVFYRLEDDAGDAISPGELPFFNLVIAGPTTDYSTLISERAVEGSVPLAEGYTYTFGSPIPEEASGSFALSAEVFREVLLNPGTDKEFSFRETAENPVHYFPVTDADPAPRRSVVTDQKCESCHEDLVAHGTIRHNSDYCAFCHSPAADDSPFRPADQLPPRSIDYKFMIHRIHNGEELTREFDYYAFMGSRVGFNEVRYPGDLRNCLACHQEGTYQVPSPGLLSTVAPREFFSPIPPASAACLGCHDTVDAAAHAFVNIAPFGESCGACHGPGAEFSVARSHARP